MNREIIIPVREWTSIFIMASLSRFAITEFGRASFWGRFLASPPWRLSLVSQQERGLTHWGSWPGKLGFPHGLANRSPSSIGFSFHFACEREATPDLLPPLKRRRFRRPSPHRRVAGPFRLWLIGSTYRPSDGGGLHRSCLRTIFSRRRHASPAGSTAGIPLHRTWGGKFGFPTSASSRGGDWRTIRPKMPSPGVTSLGPFVTPPSPDLPVAMRWLLTSVETAECGQGVLYGCGPAQVGFGD